MPAFQRVVLRVVARPRARRAGLIAGPLLRRSQKRLRQRFRAKVRRARPIAGQTGIVKKADGEGVGAIERVRVLQIRKKGDRT